MKLTDYIVQFIADLGVTHVFLVSGGAAIHLVDSISKNPAIDYVCNNHEQACAMAADGYARVSENIGVAMSTSGPGATNLITGIAGAYYDSVPVLYITGQVTTGRLKGDSGVRQVGFQETETVEMCKPITKYATMIRDAKDIRYELEKAVFLAKDGRKGPVLIDLPDDLQRSDIDVDTLVGFTPPVIETSLLDIFGCFELIREAKKPIVVLGNGARLSGSIDYTKKFLEHLGFPVLQTWAVQDVFPFNHPLHAGSFGQHGSKYGNIAIQNADLLLVLGSRLDTHQTGSLLDNFAPNAKKIIVDIDNNELSRMTCDVSINADIDTFIRAISRYTFFRDVSGWCSQVAPWTEK